MFPTPPNPAKADELLDSIRASLDSWDAAPPGEEGDDVELEALRNLADRMRRLDTHLSMGGTPPTAWTEGPDEPLVDDTGVQYEADDQYAVMVGNAIDGHVLYGPFLDADNAGEWADKTIPSTSTWWIAPVQEAY